MILHENNKKFLNEVVEKLGHPININDIDYDCSYHNDKKVIINGSILTYDDIVQLKNGEWLLLRIIEIASLIKKLLKQEEEMCT